MPYAASTGRWTDRATFQGAPKAIEGSDRWQLGTAAQQRLLESCSDAARFVLPASAADPLCRKHAMTVLRGLICHGVRTTFVSTWEERALDNMPEHAH